MNTARLSSGVPLFDKLLGGGYENDVVSVIYGPGGSGKTNLCMLCAVSAANKKKVIFVDTEGGFSIERLKQICPDYDKVVRNIVFFRPTTFEDQKLVFEKLKKEVEKNVGVVIVDTIASLYRFELGKNRNFYEVNRNLAVQLGFLGELARKQEIPVLITSQVYSTADEKSSTKIVGGDLIRYACKCIVELQKIHKGRRKAILKKHRSLPEGAETVFEITGTGIEPTGQ